MNNKYENLDQYFTAARQAPVVISLDTVKDLIHQIPPVFKIKPTKTIINSKLYIMTTLTAVTTAAVIYTCK